MVTQTGEKQALKTELREALATYGGNTKHEVVINAIEKLQAVNPTTAPSRNNNLLDGNWLLISAPNFPGGELLEHGKYSYTLGRLAFNMFQPVKLKLVIDRVLQPVFPVNNGQQRSHDIIVEFTTIEDNLPEIKGIVHNFGICEPKTDSSLQVQFTGSMMKPQEQQNLDVWKSLFNQQSKSSNKSWKEKVGAVMAKIMFGLVPPEQMNPKTGEVSFSMRRPPKGSLDIIYVDEELRITRGEKGTVLVCQRLST
ncbi:PAP/fibrillin family protein [Gloeothece verrucosa]|uniref:PAP fibrillin family protein n=1 Tax=Gloeothece verrucosa (strain PCC 7822) TaxID=497965 RepID=E0UHU9_GLOV7|nr:PAP/fibrillin family protein [Gloeothece verrucosa]ADN14479.1 PAP fibrillin family protein [Gloeothece verrucosa PCC 7822]